MRLLGPLGVLLLILGLLGLFGVLAIGYAGLLVVAGLIMIVLASAVGSTATRWP